jgi:hypothetical protein
MARYEVASPLGYYGATATSSTPILHAKGEIIEMRDDAPCSLYWLPRDAAAESAIAREQERQLQKRGGLTGWSAWGGCLPHGTGGVRERTDGGPPVENWPPPVEGEQQQARTWPPKSRLARHNR